jgi:hypothetical protein
MGFFKVPFGIFGVDFQEGTHREFCRWPWAGAARPRAIGFAAMLTRVPQFAFSVGYGFQAALICGWGMREGSGTQPKFSIRVVWVATAKP